jgi:hypothetical protein
MKTFKNPMQHASEKASKPKFQRENLWLLSKFERAIRLKPKRTKMDQISSTKNN